jgi:glycosyltransferase involved in cell wall biosynthesis
MTPEITVIVIHRKGESADITLNSLKLQTCPHKLVIVEDTGGKGAPWARNEGFKQVDTEFVLFSDNDISWKSRALQTMLKTLKMTKASYCYGRYLLDQDVWSDVVFDKKLLKTKPYISTMSLIRTKDFPGFDENIKRLQDWDLWLTMLEQGKYGVYCHDLVFTTKFKNGISFGNTFNYVDAVLTIKKKHHLE